MNRCFVSRQNPVLFRALGLLACVAAPSVPALEIPTPANAQEFGAQVVFLDNGNIVVTAPGYDLPGAADVGAVFLYRSDGALISTLTGSTAGDRIGNYYDPVIKLRNGHFVVRSIDWARNANTPRAGAVTWINANTGLNGVVSAGNSLVGSATDDRVGANGVVALSNGHYVVSSCGLPNLPPANYSAATWSNGNGGTVGNVTTANSLMSPGIDVYCQVYALPNGNYVVANPGWKNGANNYAGAVTWGNGLGGTVGAVSVANSLVGGRAYDGVGHKVVVLRNGNVVTATDGWDNVADGLEVDAGAATWMRGTGPTVGALSASNSLIGLNPGDRVGTDIVALSNGHYVVASPYWDDIGITDVGAVTWGNGATGTIGRVNANNSLLGTRQDDRIGGAGPYSPRQVIALSNGHYAVSSPNWSTSTLPAVGAVTWVDGNGPRTGRVSAGNSLVGTSANDRVGAWVAALSNGHYVASSLDWDHAQTPDVGAVTWRNGNGPSPGVVAASNSLIGTLANDRIGYTVPLTNGNYVVWASYVDLNTNPPVRNVGAVTWCSGTGVTSAAVSTANSFVGSSQDDYVGMGVVALSNGNYVAGASFFDAFGMENTGALTWGNGSTSGTGFVSSANSLVGSVAHDVIGSDVSATADGSYIIRSPDVDFFVHDGGMIAFGARDGSTVGTTPSAISVLGATPGGGSSMVHDYDAVRERLIVGLPADNRIQIVSTNPNLLFRNGFE